VSGTERSSSKNRGQRQLNAFRPIEHVPPRVADVLTVHPGTSNILSSSCHCHPIHNQAQPAGLTIDLPTLPTTLHSLPPGASIGISSPQSIKQRIQMDCLYTILCTTWPVT